MDSIVVGRFRSLIDARAARTDCFSKGFAPSDLAILHLQADHPLADASQSPLVGAKAGAVVGLLAGLAASVLLVAWTAGSPWLIVVGAVVGLGVGLAPNLSRRPRHGQAGSAGPAVAIAARVVDPLQQDRTIKLLRRAGALSVVAVPGVWSDGRWKDLDRETVSDVLEPVLVGDSGGLRVS
ncbi:MAG: hypothetical protein KIT73_00980 [Burkholderiales bacterium]|nr:hypothetical protein [Burkholderiales bacterium]